MSAMMVLRGRQQAGWEGTTGQRSVPDEVDFSPECIDVLFAFCIDSCPQEADQDTAGGEPAHLE